MHQSTRNAFTLVELLVVMAIISVLAALLLPALEKAIDSARLVQCVSHQRQISQAIQTYANDYNGSVPPGYATNDSGTYFSGIAPTWQWGIYYNPAYSSTLEDHFAHSGGQIYGTYLDSADVFYCPDHVMESSLYTGAINRSLSYGNVRGFGFINTPTTTYMSFVTSYLYPQIDDATMRSNYPTYGTWNGRMLHPTLSRNAEAHNPMMWDYTRYHASYNYQAHKLRAANVAYWDGAVRTYPRAEYVYTVLYGFHTTDAWDLLKEF